MVQVEEENLINLKVYKSLFNSLIHPCLIWKKNNEGFKLLDFNPAAEKSIILNSKMYKGQSLQEYSGNHQEIHDLIQSCYHKKERISADIIINLDINENSKRYTIYCSPLSTDEFLIEFEDITQMHQFKKKVRESKRRMEQYLSQILLIIENVPISIYLVNKKGVISWANTHFINLFQLKKKDVMGKRYDEFLPSDQAKKLKEEDQEVIDNRQPKFNITKSLKTPLGKKYFIAGKIPQYDLKKKFRGIITFFLDITKEKITERELVSTQKKLKHIIQALEKNGEKEKNQAREMNSIYKLITENANDLLAVLNEDMVFQYINEKAFQKTMGYSNKDLIGKRVIPWMHPNDVEKIINDFGEELNSGESYLEARFKDNWGNYHWLEVKWKIFEDSQAESKLFIIARDITEKKKIEQKIKESEEKYKALFNESPLSILLLDLNGKFMDCNPARFRIFGGTRAELINKNISEFSHFSKQHTPVVINAFEKFLKGELSEPIEVQAYNKSEQLIWANIQASLVHLGDKTLIQVLSQDITEKKIAEQKLKESEDKFRTITEQSLLGIFIAQDNKFVYVNKAYADMMGYPIEELMGKDLLEFNKLIHPKDRTFVLEQFAKKQAGESDVISKYQCRGIKKSGEVIWIHLYSKTILYKGKPADIVTMIDITSLKKVEKKLKDSEQKYRDITELLPDVIYEVNEQLKITYVNPIGLEKFGYTPEDLENSISLPQLISPEYIDKALSKINEIFQGKETQPDEYLLVKKDGTKFHARVNSRPIFKEGKIIGMRGTVSDINDMVLANRKLMESQEKYYQLFNHAPFAIVLSSVEGRILDCNDEAERLSGYTRDELISKNFSIYKLYKDFEHADLEKRKELTLKSSIPKPKEIELIRKDGSSFWALTKLTFITLGNEIYIQAIIQDITDTKKVEQELIKLNQLKSDLLRRTSHELKTPLVSIKGFSDLLLELHSEKLDTDMITLINEIKGGCTRLETLIYDILKAARLESGKLPLNLEFENLAFLIRYTVNEIKPLADMRKQVITLNTHKELFTLLEKEKIHDVISNLLTNAVKNTPVKGIIEISTDIKYSFYWVRIKDNGIGLTEDEKSQIFKQFGKIERYGKGWDLGIEGSGLGLYISQKIIEAHGGTIWAESEGRNKGATFTFTLPIRKK